MSIGDITVQPRGINDLVRIDALRVITPGLDFLLNGEKSMRKGEIPERMGVQIHGARVNLNGPLAVMLEQIEASQLGEKPSAQQVCSLSSKFMTAQYRELGVDELVFETEFNIERGLSPSQLVMNMHYSLRDIEEADFSMTLDGLGNSIMSVALSTPLLESIKVTYKAEQAFGQRLLDYCTELQGVDVPTFISQLLDRNDEYYVNALGFVPGPGIRAALKQFIQSQGEVRIVAHPDSPLDISKLHLYNPRDWPNLFGLLVTVNGTEVNDLSFSIPKLSEMQRRGEATAFKFPGLDMLYPASKQSVEQQSAAVTPVPRRNQRNRQRYRTVDRKEVSQWVGKNARISTVDGKRRSGLIMSVKNGIISLEMRIQGGTLSTTVPVAKAHKIEVLDRG